MMKIIIRRPDNRSMWWPVEIPPAGFFSKKIYEPEIHGQAKAVIISGRSIRSFGYEDKLEKGDKVFGVWTEIEDIGNFFNDAVIPFKLNNERVFRIFEARFTTKLTVTNHVRLFERIKDSSESYLEVYQRLQRELKNALRADYDALPYRYLAAKNAECFSLPFDHDLLKEVFYKGEKNIRIAGNRISNLSDYGMEIQSISLNTGLPQTDIKQIEVSGRGVLSAEFEEQLRGVVNRIKGKDLDIREREMELFIKHSPYFKKNGEEK